MSRSAGQRRHDTALGRGAYGATDALRLINFRRSPAAAPHKISGRAVARWLGRENSGALWTPDFQPVEGDSAFDVSFRDLIELRFVKTFRDAGLSLQTIRECSRTGGEAVRLAARRRARRVSFEKQLAA